MNDVISYPPIIDTWSAHMLLREIRMFDPLPGNMWIGIHDEPENTIEKYILDSFDMYLSKEYPTAVGLEWWFHIFKEDDKMLAFHSDHDEMIRRETGEMKFPLRSTVTYVNAESLSPTILLDSKCKGEHEKNVSPFPPTKCYFSLPEEGKFITFNPRCVHGVLPDSAGRVTLMYNVWDYRPDALNRIGHGTHISNCRFTVETGAVPTHWLGDTFRIDVDCLEQRLSMKGPKGANNEGDTWVVDQ